jgi:hypothetical protein
MRPGYMRTAGSVGERFGRLVFDQKLPLAAKKWDLVADIEQGLNGQSR